jgi:hypothetical protein
MELIKRDKLCTREEEQRQNTDKELDGVKRFSRELQVKCAGHLLRKAAGECNLDEVKTLTEHDNQELIGYDERKRALLCAICRPYPIVSLWLQRKYDFSKVMLYPGSSFSLEYINCDTPCI